MLQLSVARQQRTNAMSNGLGLAIYLIGNYFGYRLKITGTITVVVLRRFGIQDPQNAFFSTSPEAVGVLIGLVGDTRAELPVVLSFHIFQDIFYYLHCPTGI